MRRCREDNSASVKRTPSSFQNLSFQIRFRRQCHDDDTLPPSSVCCSSTALTKQLIEKRSEHESRPAVLPAQSQSTWLVPALAALLRRSARPHRGDGPARL